MVQHMILTCWHGNHKCERRRSGLCIAMTHSSAGTVLCEPTVLYNILTQCAGSPAVLDGTYLVLFDVRERNAYNESHVILARHAKKYDQGSYKIPFDVHLPTSLHCVVYDSNTVSTVEDTLAVNFASMLASSGSKNPVMILKGGYERFSAEYPFLRTQKIMYTPMEIQHLPFLPSEVLPLFLYLGDRRHAYNAAMNYDLKIHAHVNMGGELHSAFPGAITELHVDVEDCAGTELLERFKEICEFLESHRKKSERVLVFSELGISRAATAIIAYLIKGKQWSLKESYEHVQQCRHHIKPLQAFVEQLSKWETQVHGKALTNTTHLQH